MQIAQEIRLPQKDWDAFLRWNSPLRFDEIIDRSKLGFPSWFMPNARGAVVPARQLHFMKCSSSHRTRPEGWYKIRPHIFRQGRGAFGQVAIRFGGLWSLMHFDEAPAALTFNCGSTPVLFRQYREAMWFFDSCIAELFDGRNVYDLQGYSWTSIVPTCPNPIAVDALAKFKRSLESADRAFWIKYDKSHGRGPALAA